MTKEHKIFILVVVVLLLVLGYALTMLPPVRTEQRIAPPALYPDPIETPCSIATSDFKELTATSSCGTYSQCHRKTSEALKKRVCEIYPDNCKVPNEKDHQLAICAGGADSLLNLWSQKRDVLWNGQNFGYPEKDRLEFYVCEQIKAGKMDIKTAQKEMCSDWVAMYQKYIGNKDFGAGIIIDPDDEIIQ